MDASSKAVCAETADLLLFLAELIERKPESSAEPLKDFEQGLRYLNNLIDKDLKPRKDYYDFIRVKLLEFRRTYPGLTPSEYLNMAMEAERALVG